MLCRLNRLLLFEQQSSLNQNSNEIQIIRMFTVIKSSDPTCLKEKELKESSESLSLSCVGAFGGKLNRWVEVSSLSLWKDHLRYKLLHLRCCQEKYLLHKASKYFQNFFFNRLTIFITSACLSALNFLHYAPLSLVFFITFMKILKTLI